MNPEPAPTDAAVVVPVAPIQRPFWQEEPRRMAIAVIFLTRVPLRLAGDVTPADIAAASRYYPLVGGLVGAAVGGMFVLAGGYYPPLLAATLAALGAAVLTGAFHEDALGDVADAFGGGMSVARKLEIMKDSRLGTYGVLALVGALLLRIQAIAGLPLAVALPALVAVHAASRAGIVGMLWRSPRARTEGLGADTVGLSWREPLVALATALLLGLLCLPLPAALGVLALCLLSALGMDRYAREQVGGVTGDVLGASQQVGELVALLALGAWLAIEPAVVLGAPVWRP
ncbi:MAG: adenosylcobinamide-GDP ribazoletransferase [Candidatus Sericytochromatia bacterium]|nr:adenosylcobinamide-GDP ribazoletransferase [Candidatus Sericytochromatia bacterium]